MTYKLEEFKEWFQKQPIFTKYDWNSILASSFSWNDWLKQEDNLGEGDITYWVQIWKKETGVDQRSREQEKKRMKREAKKKKKKTI